MPLLLYIAFHDKITVLNDIIMYLIASAVILLMVIGISSLWRANYDTFFFKKIKHLEGECIHVKIINGIFKKKVGMKIIIKNSDKEVKLKYYIRTSKEILLDVKIGDILACTYLPATKIIDEIEAKDIEAQEL